MRSMVGELRQTIFSDLYLILRELWRPDVCGIGYQVLILTGPQSGETEIWSVLRIIGTDELIIQSSQA